MTKEDYIKITEDIKAVLKDITKCRRHNKAAIRNCHRFGDDFDKYPLVDGKYEKRYGKDYVNTLHILYNRFRNRPPHTGSVERDNQLLVECCSERARDMIEKIKENHDSE